MNWVAYLICAIIYTAFGIVSGFFFLFGNTTPYANAKSVVVALFWPLAWVWLFIYSFGYWVTRR